ncbi:MAG TPA: hypothetical protein VM142_13490 [Acidimicrobiales bacterium]|nr:hypothetical protein [Acidimicrobiales bacterium]
MENLESAFDRPRPAAGALRLAACVAIAVLLVLAGRTLAPGSAPRSDHRGASSDQTVPEVIFDHIPGPLDEPLPGYEDHHLDEARPSVPSEWCRSSKAAEPAAPEASWATSRLVSNNGTYTLRHPAGWQVVEAPTGGYLITPPDDKTAVVVMFDPAYELAGKALMAEGSELLADFAGELEVERSERTTLAGTPACRLIAQPLEAGQIPSEYLLTILGEDVAAGAIYGKLSVSPGEKELARRVLHSLRPEPSQA